MREPAPLTTLLSQAWIAFAMEVDNLVEAVAAGRRAGLLFRISLAMWANGLRCIDEDGITVDELRRRAGAGCNLGGLERWRWIRIGEGSGRRDGFGTSRGIRRDTVLRPTRAGVFARRVWPEAVATVEERWRARFGAAAVDAVGQALPPLSTPMPWAPPEVHVPDGFFTSVVERTPGAEDAPLVARLGQTLTALTLEAERDAGVSVPMGANILRVIGDRDVPVRDLPRLSGVSKEAVAMGVGEAARGGLAGPPKERSVALTEAGLGSLVRHRARVGRLDDAGLRAALDAILSRPATLAEGLVPPDKGWRAAAPYLAQTRRVLADPIRALPWHPMVLHRGGWPDGS